MNKNIHMIENNFKLNSLADFYLENSQYKNHSFSSFPTADRFTSTTFMVEGKQKQALQQSFNLSNMIFYNLWTEKQMKGVTFISLKGKIRIWEDE